MAQHVHVVLCTPQETATQEQLLSKARELQLEDKLKSLEAEKSDLEATVEKLQKQIMKLEEIHSSDIEQLVEVYTVINLCMACMPVVQYDMCFSSLLLYIMPIIPCSAWRLSHSGSY